MSRNDGATMTADQTQTAQRHLAIVLEHMRYENAHDFDRCIAAFGHPRYEIVPTGEVHDGTDGVGGLLEQNRTAFADFHFEPHRTAPAGDVVLVEGTFTGTHTGTCSGLGLEAAVALARLGARVVLVGRNPAKTAAASDYVRQRSGSPTVELSLCDFASQASIHRLAAELLARCPRLEILVNNAGTVSVERKVTVDGIELTFAVNHLGYYLLTRLLRDRIVASAPARIVNVASHLHYRGTLDFADLEFERGYHVLKAYARSKLGNVLLTCQLAKRLRGTGVTVNALHPGDVATNIWSGAPSWSQRSEEHTSELQSLAYLVCRLLLEKKK